MKFQVNDRVIFDGKICCVKYANADVVICTREIDCHTIVRSPEALANEQVPWVLLPRAGWWSQMRDIGRPGLTPSEAAFLREA